MKNLKNIRTSNLRSTSELSNFRSKLEDYLQKIRDNVVNNKNDLDQAKVLIQNLISQYQSLNQRVTVLENT